jgi:hypothetical protein
MAFWTMKICSSGGGTVTVSSPTSGNIDGTNAIFGSSLTVAPTFAVSDGATFRQGHGWTWNAGSFTVTMGVAPQYDLYFIS